MLSRYIGTCMPPNSTECLCIVGFMVFQRDIRLVSWKKKINHIISIATGALHHARYILPPPPPHRARRLSWTEAKCCWLIVARSDLLSRLALLCDPGNVGSRLAGEASLTRRDCLIHLQEVLYGTYWSRKGNKSQKSCSSTDSLRSGHVATRLRRCSGCRRRGRLGNTMGFSGWWSEKIILLHHC